MNFIMEGTYEADSRSPIVAISQIEGRVLYSFYLPVPFFCRIAGVRHTSEKAIFQSVIADFW